MKKFMSIWYSSKQYCLTLMKSLFYYSTEAIFPTICAVCNTCQKVSRSILYWWFFWRILTVIYVQQSFIIATENDGYVKIMMMTLVLQFQAAWHSMKRDSPLNFKKKNPFALRPQCLKITQNVGVFLVLAFSTNFCPVW